MKPSKHPLRAFAVLLVALTTILTPMAASASTYDPAIDGSYAIGHCLDATHQTMGPGQYVEAPTSFDPTTASDTEIACYGFAPGPIAPRIWHTGRPCITTSSTGMW